MGTSQSIMCILWRVTLGRHKCRPQMTTTSLPRRGHSCNPRYRPGKKSSTHVWNLHQEDAPSDPHNGAHQSFQKTRRGLASQEPIVHHCPGFISTSINDVSMTGYNALDLPFRYLLRVASHQGVVNGRNVVDEALRPYRSRMCTLCEFARQWTVVRRARMVLLA